MSKIDEKKLIFRLGEIGFVVDLTAVVEVIEDTSALLDFECSDIDCGIVSAMRYRQAMIPAIDPTLKLNILSPVRLSEKAAIVLRGAEGHWALLVDRVESLLEANRFNHCNLPLVLQGPAVGLYSQIKLFNNEPLIVLEPENYYGAVAA